MHSKKDRNIGINAIKQPGPRLPHDSIQAWTEKLQIDRVPVGYGRSTYSAGHRSGHAVSGQIVASLSRGAPIKETGVSPGVDQGQNVHGDARVGVHNSDGQLRAVSHFSTRVVVLDKWVCFGVLHGSVDIGDILLRDMHHNRPKGSDLTLRSLPADCRTLRAVCDNRRIRERPYGDHSCPVCWHVDDKTLNLIHVILPEPERR